MIIVANNKVFTFGLGNKEESIEIGNGILYRNCIVHKTPSETTILASYNEFNDPARIMYLEMRAFCEAVNIKELKVFSFPTNFAKAVYAEERSREEEENQCTTK